MTRDEIAEYIMKYSQGKTGLAAVGPMMEQVVFFLHWQQQQIEELKSKVEILEILGANK